MLPTGQQMSACPVPLASPTGLPQPAPMAFGQMRQGPSLRDARAAWPDLQQRLPLHLLRKLLPYQPAKDLMRRVTLPALCHAMVPIMPSIANLMLHQSPGGTAGLGSPKLVGVPGAIQLSGWALTRGLLLLKLQGAVLSVHLMRLCPELGGVRLQAMSRHLVMSSAGVGGAREGLL